MWWESHADSYSYSYSYSHRDSYGYGNRYADSNCGTTASNSDTAAAANTGASPVGRSGTEKILTISL